MALQHFPSIAGACVAACEDLPDPIKAKFKARFEEFEDLASKAFTLLKMIKSQDRLDPDKFNEALLDVALAWKKTFPNVDCFNKLHFLLEHYPDFIRRYRMCSRKSAKSHESVHTLISSLKDAVKRMTSTSKMFNTIFSRSTEILRPGMAEVQNKVLDKTKGKKRGKYITNNATRRQDEVEFMATIFGPTVQVEGEEFVELVGGGRIPSIFKSEYLFVKTARAPDEWIRGLEGLNVLSAVKVEESRYACH